MAKNQTENSRAANSTTDAKMLAAIARLTFTRRSDSARMSTAGRHMTQCSAISRP